MNEDLKELRANQSELSSALARIESKLDQILSKSQNSKPHKELLDVVDVAELCMVSQQSVYKWAAKGILPKCKINARLRFRYQDVLNLLKSKDKNTSTED